MSATKEGRVGYKFNFDLQSPSILLVKEKSITQNGIESTTMVDDTTNNRKIDEENTDSPVQIKKKILDDETIGNSDSISNKSINIDLYVDKNSTNESSSNMENKSNPYSNKKLLEKVEEKQILIK